MIGYGVYLGDLFAEQDQITKNQAAKLPLTATETFSFIPIQNAHVPV